MEDKNSSSILKTPLNKGHFKEMWKMEENLQNYSTYTVERNGMVPLKSLVVVM